MKRAGEGEHHDTADIDHQAGPNAERKRIDQGCVQQKPDARIRHDVGADSIDQFYWNMIAGKALPVR
jgi:hypothetical protein